MLKTQIMTPADPLWNMAAEQIGAIEWPAGAALKQHMLAGSWQPFERVIYMTDGATLVGFCGVTAEDVVRDVTYTPFISTVYVNPEYRHRGLSLTLVRTAEKVAVEAHINGIYIVTQHVGLYEHLDFQMIDQKPDRFGRTMRVLYKKLA
ncbi:hypothetical protein FD13_GL001633 [Levilactobacillus senmaizukei DSM 21775 = NBRC 103853]|uniref:N-acetyltransferase domain-containing protein n=1 Tax=Levilactobacillus senmaizukei DSM 21775 = NBRC 103853 TaxID=1423803 RepID=A0A0R2DH18_9LACO|nr:GNAT family N-acetyltransferase [Levilactobacillus senmaizukei]KRN02643.1 hypothetical protein FD13_GL001633 [Levilactobacillus senmaizukei DSM 21775 = NBRC 103853]